MSDGQAQPTQPCYRTRLAVSGTSVPEIAKIYARWALGVEPFAQPAAADLAFGSVTSERVIAGGDFEGVRARLRVRWDRETFLLHLSHGDTREGTVHRRHFVEVAPTSKGVRIEHVASRALPDGTAHAPLRIPTMVTHLVDRFSGAVQPNDLVVGTAVDVVAEDVQGFVDALFDPGRSVPYVFVTPTIRGGNTLLDPDELARALVSIAEVHVLADPDLTWTVRDALLARGATQQHSCFDGGVRLYRTGFTARAPLHDHPLLLRRWFEGFSEDQRVARVTERVARHLADDVDLHAWTQRIDRLDRASPPPAAPASAPASKAQPAATRDPEVHALRDRIAALEAEIAGFNELLGEADEECRAAEARARTAERALEQAIQERDSAVEDAQSAFRLGTVLDAVEAAGRVFSERLVIFPGVMKTAEDSPFHRPPHAFLVLTLLAVTADDGELRTMLDHHFSDRQTKWRATDSEATAKTFPRRFIGEDGRVNTSTRHITLGGSERAERHLQIYYDRLPGGRVAILHVGRHLPTVSYDT